MDQLRSWLGRALELPLARVPPLAARGPHVRATTTCTRRRAVRHAQRSTRASTSRRPACTRTRRASSPRSRRDAPRGVELPASIPTIGTMLRAQGYYTAYKGKWHLSVVNQKVAPAPAAIAIPTRRSCSSRTASPTTTTTASTRVSCGSASGTTECSRRIRSTCCRGSQRAAPRASLGSSRSISSIRTTSCSSIRKATAGVGRHADDAGAENAALRQGLGLRPAGELPRGRSLDEARRCSARSNALSEEQLRVYQNYYFNCIRDVDQHVAAVLDALDRLRARGQHGRRRDRGPRRARRRARRHARQRRRHI